MRSIRFPVLGACAVLAAVGVLPGLVPAADTIRVIHHFGEDDGEYPDTDLVTDAAGNLYGNTVQGGDFNSGTVFKLTKTPAGWSEAVLYSFTSGADGGQAYGGVTLDAAGNIYGTTVVGGQFGACPEDGCGVVWKLTNNGGSYSQSVIHYFQGGMEDGYGPGGPLSFDAQGRLYGMTPGGGEFGLGTIFQLTPTLAGPWDEVIIHDFSGGEDGGGASKARLLIEGNGDIYGVATVGGLYGVGTVFRLSPAAGGGFDYATLYAFQGAPDGVFPYGGVIRDAAGDLYGTTYYGGTQDVGVVYRLTEKNGVWTETVLHQFKDGVDGSYPISALVFGDDGALYGTTSSGGAGHGTIFQLVLGPGGQWRERIVHAFDGSDGELPYAGLLKDANGNFYGTAVHGGQDGDGTIFRFSPPPTLVPVSNFQKH
jgi:uncharacterized repeat protein (TIGR03803 family)